MIYAGTKDGKDYGFYLEKEGLKSYVELTDAEHMALIDAQSAGKQIVFHANSKPTLQDPPPPSDSDIAKEVRRKRDSLINEIQWRIERYEQQSTLGINTADSESWYKAALGYVQYLRDVPKQQGFPKDIVWQDAPK